MDRLFNYLPNAMAFIYVINSGNAGGVKYDDWVSVVIITVITDDLYDVCFIQIYTNV